MPRKPARAQAEPATCIYCEQAIDRSGEGIPPPDLRARIPIDRPFCRACGDLAPRDHDPARNCFVSLRCPRCGGPRSIEDLDRSACHRCRTGGPKGSLQELHRSLLSHRIKNGEAIPVSEFYRLGLWVSGALEIAELACELFKAPRFDEIVWERLIRFLADQLKREHADETEDDAVARLRRRDLALLLPRSEVIRRLEDEIRPKQIEPIDPKTDVIAGANPEERGDCGTVAPDAPLRLGASHKTKAKVWDGREWIEVPLSLPRFKVLGVLLEAYHSERKSIDIKELRKISGGAHQVVRKMREHPVLAKIINKPGGRGNGYALVMPCGRQPRDN